MAWYTCSVLEPSGKTLSYVKKVKPGFRSGSGSPSGPVSVMDACAGRQRQRLFCPESRSRAFMGRARMATQMPSCGGWPAASLAPPAAATAVPGWGSMVVVVVASLDEGMTSEACCWGWSWGWLSDGLGLWSGDGGIGWDVEISVGWIRSMPA